MVGPARGVMGLEGAEWSKGNMISMPTGRILVEYIYMFEEL